MLPVMMGILQHHVLHLHQSGLGASFVLVQLHGDEADILLGLRNDHVLQGVDPAAGLFDLGRHKLAGLLAFREPDQIREQIGQFFHRVVQIAGGKGVAVGVDVVGIRRSCGALKDRDLHAHHVSGMRLQIDLLLGGHQRHVQRLTAHTRAGEDI